MHSSKQRWLSPYLEKLAPRQNSSLDAMSMRGKQRKQVLALALFSLRGALPAALGGSRAHRNIVTMELPATTFDRSSLKSTSKNIEIAMFDFDQTLSTVHVFKTLGGLGVNWFGHAALSPEGQYSLLEKYPDKYNALWAFGGETRIAALRDLFEKLKKRGVKMMICTLGYPIVVKTLLEEADMLKYFGWTGVPSVVGMSNSAYADSWTSYDLQAQQELEVHTAKDEVLTLPKVQLLDELLEMEEQRMQVELPLSAGVIVEDDPEAIMDAQSYWRESGSLFPSKVDRMSYIHVKNRRGLQENEMIDLLRMAGVQE